MTWLRPAVLVFAVAALAWPASAIAAVRGTAIAQGRVALGPGYAPGSLLCAAGTRHFRVIWDETRGSPHLPSGPSARDASCATVPFIARQVLQFIESIRAAELALGFAAPRSDAWLRRDGGDGRYDIYLARQRAGEDGSTWCRSVVRGGRPTMGTAYTSIGARLQGAIDPERLLRETLAHEYFHGIQCRAAPRLDLLPTAISEGTANWMAAVVTPDAFEADGPFLGRLPARLLRSARRRASVLAQGYDGWGFWYEASGGKARPGVVADLLRRAGRVRRRSNGDTTLRAVLPDLPAVLLRYATALVGAGPLGGTTLPPAYLADVPPPAPSLDLTARRTAEARITVAAVGYRFPGVAWGDEAGTVTISVRGVPGAGVRLEGVAFRRRDHNGAVEFEIDADLAGEAIVIVVNPGPRSATVRLEAARR